ncbi:hypothetical protein ACH5RR_014659 [Cinchona calisaya]|uniref:Microtubule-associated protein 70-5 n=1 Tax=Cinchona calisaya TaxID=153742 RepID=A0ABD2ZQW6_9GENT
MSGFEEVVGADDHHEVCNVSHHPVPDPVVLELKRLHNQLKEKDRDMETAQNEIKALRATEVFKDKAVEELESEVKRLRDKLRVTENLLEQKNLDMKKLRNEKKEALAAQYAAEATLRRVYADQKDDDFVPMESIIAPLEADIKMYKNEIAALQEDKRAMERLNKSKEAALLEAEKILTSALERALIVEEVQNQNFELRRQVEICQEENKILDKTNRQKVSEVEKLSQTIVELEQAILAGGEAANTIRDCRRQISELQEGKRTLERELARVKVSANRVASVVANEWKDENDKVMPVKQWLEERRLFQAEMQRLRDKLVISEKTAKAEAQLKDKLKLRLKTLEDGLKYSSNLSVNPLTYGGSSKPEKISNFFGILSSNAGLKKRSTSQPRASTIIRSPEKSSADKINTDFAEKVMQTSSIKKVYASESLLRKSLWASRKKAVDSSEKENKDVKENSIVDVVNSDKNEILESGNTKNKCGDNQDAKGTARANIESADTVSGFLYDRLQKEVLSLRKSCEAKDSNLNAKDEDLKMLNKKIETLTKALETEYKKIKREAATKEKGPISTKEDDRMRIINSSRRATKAS